MGSLRNKVLDFFSQPGPAAAKSLPDLLVADSISVPTNLDFIRRLTIEAETVAQRDEPNAPSSEDVNKYLQTVGRVHISASSSQRPVGPTKADIAVMQEMMGRMSAYHERKARLSKAVAGMNMDEYVDVIHGRKPVTDATREQARQIEALDKDASRSVQLLQAIREVSEGLKVAVAAEALRAKPM
jgi:hypothetical protein